jgi:lipoprotein-anchoring transpeptidase ErfK/SrfK
MHIRGLRAAVGAVLALAAVSVIAGCTSANDRSNAPNAPTGPTSSPSSVPSISASSQPQDEFTSTIAHVNGTEIAVSDTPGGPTSMTLEAEDVLTVPDQTPLVLLAKTVDGDNIEVYLPIRPNGSTGWVSAGDVTLYTTTLSMDVYLADHELTISDEGEVIATYPIATGQDELPTPGGVYFIRELLAPPDPNGVYGKYAYGLSGYSPVLDNFNGGDAVIGIHGTNDPDSIGKNVSHGCIRMYNEDITELVQKWQLPLGLPVYIHE